MSRINEDSPEYKKRFIILPHEVIEPLYSWHGGQFTGVYSLASTGDHDLVSPAMIERALNELERDKSHEKKRTKRYKELDWLIGELDMVLSSPREFSAQEAGMGLEEHEYEYSPNPGCPALCENPTHSHNPNRPPKGWWDDCVAGVKASGSAASPESVCGSEWFHKMSPSARRAATRRHEGERLQENPSTGLVLGVAALLAAGAWWILSSSPAAAQPSAGTPPGPLPTPPTACVIDVLKLDAWALPKKIGAVYLPGLADPPTLTELSSNPVWGAAVQSVKAQGATLVVVTSDGSFYDYSTGSPVEDPDMRADYCASLQAPSPNVIKNATGLKGPPAFWLPSR